MEAKTLISTIGLIGLTTNILPVSGNSNQSFKVKEFSTWFPTIRNLIRTIENIESDIICLAVCASDQSCKGAFRDGSQCALFSERVIQITKKGDSSQAVRIVRPDTMVVQTTNPVSYSEAKVVCSSLDGVLASRADIQKLYEDGNALCACGWIADGYGVFPLSAGNPECGADPGVIVCLDEHTERGWCKFLPEN